MFGEVPHKLGGKDESGPPLIVEDENRSSAALNARLPAA